MVCLGCLFLLQFLFGFLFPLLKKNARTKFRNRNAARKGLSVLVFWLFLIVTLPEGRGGKGYEQCSIWNHSWAAVTNGRALLGGRWALGGGAHGYTPVCPGSLGCVSLCFTRCSFEVPRGNGHYIKISWNPSSQVSLPNTTLRSTRPSSRKNR